MLLATACNFSVHLFDAEHGTNLATLSDQTDIRPGEASYVRSICFSPDSKSLVTGGEDNTVKIWDLHDMSIRYRLVGHCAEVSSVDVPSNGRFIASASVDGVNVWDLETGNLKRKLSSHCTLALSTSPTSRYIAASCIDGPVAVWDTESATLVHKLEDHQNRVYSVSFSPCERLLLSASLDKTVKIRDIRVRSPEDCSLVLAGHTDFVLSASFSHCGSWVFSGSRDRTVRRWDPRNPNTSFVLGGHHNSVISVAHSPTDHAFSTGCGDLHARIWSYDKN